MLLTMGETPYWYTPHPFNQLSKIKLFIKEYLEAQRASITAFLIIKHFDN